MTKATSNSTGPLQAPDFKQVRKYLRTIEHREALGGFIRAGWSPAELAEFARDIYLAPGKTYPTATSYQHAMDKGAEHPYASETLASLRTPRFTMPPFSRPVPKHFAWDDPDNPEHAPELRADVAELARLWRNREARKREQPWSAGAQPIPRRLWKRLFKLRNRYHSLKDTVHFAELGNYSQPPTESTCGIIAGPACSGS